MNQLATWAAAVIMTLTASTKVERLRSETEAEMQARYTSIGTDLETALRRVEPLFPNDENRHKTASLVLAIAFFESGFIKSVDAGNRRGDNGGSYCLMQIHTGNGRVGYGPEEMRAWTGKDLAEDRTKCFAAGVEALRISIRACGVGADGRALNVYAAGKCEQSSKAAKDRWSFATRILNKFPME